MRIDLHGAVLPRCGRHAALPPLRASRGSAVKIIGFVGDSGSGKTTLVEQLISRFVGAGLRVAAIKHAHHGFDIDRPGKDSYRLRSAGAAQVLLASDERWVLMSEEPEIDAGAALARHLARLDPCDLVILEGFRGQAGVAFIEVRRAVQQRPLGGQDGESALRPPPAGRVAIASDVAAAAAGHDSGLPVLDLNDVEAIAQFIARRLALTLC